MVRSPRGSARRLNWIVPSSCSTNFITAASAAKVSFTFKSTSEETYEADHKHPFSGGFLGLLRCHGLLREKGRDLVWRQGVADVCVRPRQPQRLRTLPDQGVRGNRRRTSDDRSRQAQFLPPGRVPHLRTPKNRRCRRRR